mmetsp:Transcript_26354/g.83751  ORF Transcript_26354/g.83751 Transcript_26354/m.83751 type:complete len:223 (-) Transcript_26354:76-744(-)
MLERHPALGLHLESALDKVQRFRRKVTPVRLVAKRRVTTRRVVRQAKVAPLLGLQVRKRKVALQEHKADHTDRPDVRAGAVGTLEHNLWRGITGAADGPPQAPRGNHAARDHVRGAGNLPRMAKVDKNQIPRVELVPGLAAHEVLQLDVKVRNAVGVAVLHDVKDLGDCTARLGLVARLKVVLIQECEQIAAVAELGHNVNVDRRLEAIHEAQEVRMRGEPA